MVGSYDNGIDGAIEDKWGLSLICLQAKSMYLLQYQTFLEKPRNLLNISRKIES